MADLPREITFSGISANSNKQGVVINIFTKDALVVLSDQALLKNPREDDGELHL
jgi:hypothetical protein